MIQYDPTWALAKVSQQHEDIAQSLKSLRWPENRSLPLPLPGNPYGRLLLAQCGDAELVLIRWRPGQRCAIHDHGSGHGFVYLLQGAIEEESWENPDSLFRAEPATKTHWAVGSTIPISSSCLHSMLATETPTISLHLYLGVTQAMNIYDPNRFLRLLVPSDHGAWIPTPDNCMEEFPWPTR